MGVFSKMLSPILIPIIAVLIFTITLETIINRIRQLPMESGGVAGGFFSRLIKRKMLIAMFFSALSAFSVWLSTQPQEFKATFLFPIEFFTGVISSNAPLYTLATALAGIALATLLL